MPFQFPEETRIQSIEVIPVVSLTQQRVRVYVWSPAHGQTKILFPRQNSSEKHPKQAMLWTSPIGVIVSHTGMTADPNASYLFLFIRAS